MTENQITIEIYSNSRCMGSDYGEKKSSSNSYKNKFHTYNLYTQFVSRAGNKHQKDCITYVYT